MDQKQLLSKDDLKDEFKAYKKFAFKGDMLKMAIAFILGGAFNKVVSSLSENILMPFLNFFVNKTPGGNWREAVWTPIEGMVFEAGKFAAVTIDFILMTLVLFVLLRILRGHMAEDDEEIEQKPFIERLKDFVLGDWFFPFAAGLAVIIMIFSHSWMAGVWAFVGMSLAVSWFQNRELRKKSKVQEEVIKETKKKVEEQTVKVEEEKENNVENIS